MPVTITIQLCPLCGKVLPERGGRFGLVVELGHSRGGWGWRRDDVKFSDEVCVECFDAIMPRLRVLWQELLADRKNANKTFVVVTNPLGGSKIKEP
jgi:hypothetical protein